MALQDSMLELVSTDGRQSATAAAVQRGVCRLLRAHGFAMVTELSLASGRRADVMAINGTGMIWAVEIKSCIADIRADMKWPEYEEFCDRLYFAIPPDMPTEVMPADRGLIVADQWGAEFLRHTDDNPLAAARRKAVTLRFARAAALRLHSISDPNG